MFIYSRYLPSRPQPITYYVRPGVIVDNEQSNARQVLVTFIRWQKNEKNIFIQPLFEFS